jgi:predicted permease
MENDYSTANRKPPKALFAFTYLETIWIDLRQGARSLWRNPVVFVVAVFSLGIGIGTTSTIYALVDQLLIHDVTARDPDRLVRLTSRWNSYPNYRDIRESGVFEELAAGNICYPSLRWRIGDQTREIVAECVSANYFQVIGVHAARGRTFSSDEAAAEKDPRAVVISDQFWKQRLEGDPNVIGREITLNNKAFTIIGVLPTNYRTIEGVGARPEVFVPLNTTLYPRLFDRRNSMLPLIIGRLAPGRTSIQTQQALWTVLNELADRYPEQAYRKQSPPPELVPVSGTAKHGEGSSIVTFSVALSAVAAVVFLIACANVAGLLLARGVSRQREIAIRLAVGATRLRLVRQLMVETTIVAAAGATVGIGLTYWTAGLLTKITIPGVPSRFEVFPDWRFACFVAALSVIATLLCGLVPALASSRTDLYNSLRVSQQTAPRPRLRSLLVTAQIALSVILLFEAFVLTRNLAQVLHFDPGFDAAHAFWFEVLADERTYPAALREKVYRELESHPGVESISWAWYLPFNFSYAEPRVRRADAADPASFQVTQQGIGPGYLKTMGIRLLAGREFNWNDLKPRDKALPQPVIVNEAFARRYLQGRNPIGERLMSGLYGVINEQMEIIGLSANTSFRSPGEEPEPLLQSLSQIGHSFVVRMVSPSAAAELEMSKKIERNVPGAGVSSLAVRKQLDRGLWPTRAVTTLLGILAAIGLVLALIGLCGLSIYNVTRRTPELCIRAALGATAGDVMWLVLREGLAFVIVGAVIGIACTLALTRLLVGFLFLAAGVSPLDPLAFVAMLATLLATATGSIYFTSRRVTKIDPSMSLRIE